MKKDESKAKEVFNHLKIAGADPWLDMISLKPGNKLEHKIKKAVKNSDAFVVCLRPEFNKYGFRQREVRWAREALEMRTPETEFIIPFIIKPCRKLPNWCKPYHAGNYRTEPTSIKDLIAAINEHCNANLVLGVREIKYILSKQYYNRLKRYLLGNAEDIKTTEQWNFYYYDEFDVFLNQKAMARLRVEKLSEQESSNQIDRILLTFKTNAVTCPDGTEIRPEKNCDLTEKLAAEFHKNAEFTEKDVIKFVNNLDFDNHLREDFKPFLESLKGEFYREGIESVDKLKLNMRCKMKNLRFRAITRHELTLELDMFTTNRGEYYELEVETNEIDEARRDEYIHLLFATLNIPIVCPKEKLGRYPPKVAIMLHDAGIINLEGRLTKGKVNAEELIRKTHKEVCSICQALFKS
jgi:adenylate cyclase class IV